ncbi:MAG: acyl carrier protein [Verrucomicrobiales bacterium]
MSAPAALAEKSPEEIREELLGFPETTIDAVMRFRSDGGIETLTEVVLRVIEYYLPRDKQVALLDLPASTHLSDDLGADSLLIAEVGFKLEELLGVGVDLQAGTPVETLGDLIAILRQRLD